MRKKEAEEKTLQEAETKRSNAEGKRIKLVRSAQHELDELDVQKMKDAPEILKMLEEHRAEKEEARVEARKQTLKAVKEDTEAEEAEAAKRTEALAAKARAVQSEKRKRDQ
jgi:hypothetical protein